MVVALVRVLAPLAVLVQALAVLVQAPVPPAPVPVLPAVSLQVVPLLEPLLACLLQLLPVR
ncbi:hypothetical protein [Halomonas salinarum]|uniref:hypothetical protein n=1 Tax=Halomonas salinarum TaxID=1158993 RepID=UPI00143B07E0|nr:hypothetical protein [Halomonas salinarum]